MTDKPLLSILLTIAPGIIVGSYWFGLVPLPAGVGLTLLFSAVAVLLRSRSAALSTVMLLASSFMLGVVLVTSSIRHGSEPVVAFPLMDEVEEYMSNQREKMLANYRLAGLPDDVSGVVSAMTLGERQGISHELKESYRISGVSHVFALSGMHLAIIFMFLSMLLPTRLFPRASAVVQMLLVWTYVMLVGIHPSIIRAAVMFTCYLLCNLLSRSTHGIDVLILTAVLLLVYNPLWLFDVGFQMSFMAMTGILLFAGRIQEMLRRHDVLAVESPACYALYGMAYYVLGLLAVTISATLGTAPLIVLYFGRLSCYGLLANLIVSPCATLILLFAFLLQFAVILQAHIPLLSPLTTLLASMLKGTVNLLNASVQWIASLPGASVDGISLTPQQVILVYVIIISLALLIHRLHRALSRPHV